MTKTQVRILKSHYLARWAVLRRNQKHVQKVLLLVDQFVLKNLTTGSTLCHNCLGEMYQDLIPNLSTSITDVKHKNLVLINNIEFKYKTLEQVADYINELSSRVLLPNGRLIISFEHRFLVYNRVEVSVDTLLSSWIQSLTKFKLQRMTNLLGKAPSGYGDYFFCLEYNE